MLPTPLVFRRKHLIALRLGLQIWISPWDVEALQWWVISHSHPCKPRRNISSCRLDITRSAPSTLYSFVGLATVSLFITHLFSLTLGDDVCLWTSKHTALQRFSTSITPWKSWAADEWLAIQVTLSWYRVILLKRKEFRNYLQTSTIRTVEVLLFHGVNECINIFK